MAPGLIAAFYATGVAAGPHLFDAGELAAAAWGLSGSHPPGQTVHALLAHAACLLPVGPIPARIALLSVVCLWFAALLTGRATRLLCTRLQLDGVADWAATASAVCVMLAPPLVRQATRVEVYTLALALCAWSVLELLRWAFDGGRGPLLRAALVAGLCASVHPPHALAAVVLGAALAVSMRREVLSQPATLAAAAAATLLAVVATTAYLPVRAAAGAAMWGDPTTMDGLLAYVTGRTFQQKTFAGESTGYLPALAGYLRHATLALGVLPVLSAMWLCARPAPAGRVGRVLLASACLSAAAAAIQPLQAHIPDHVAYLGPALVLFAIAGALGFAHAVHQWKGAARIAAVVAMAVAALNPSAWGSVADAARADLPALETLTGSLTQTPPPRAMALTTSDFAGSAWMMAQSIDGARPDVALFLEGFVTSSWQWHQLARHPALDGEPVRGVGQGAREAYLDGLLRSTLPNIPVALERDPLPIDGAAVAGPYIVLEPHPTDATPLRMTASIGERLVAAIAADRRRGPPGDYGSGDGIVRQYEVIRARRLLVRGEVLEGLRGLVRASDPMPGRLSKLGARAALRDLPLPGPPTVGEPVGFAVSARDAQRQLAVALWRFGQTDQAQQILRWQLGEGDPRALLQLAWLSAASGDRATALEALEGFLEAAPHLAGEARTLGARVRGN